MFPYAPISNVVPRQQYIAGLNQAIYGTLFTANDASDILVYERAPNVPANDLLQLVPSSHYTVQFIGSNNIVQVTFLNAYIPTQYNIITVMRATPSQFLNLYNNTNFTPSMLNGDFETLTLVDQQNQLYWQNLVPRYNNSATVNVPIDTILPVLGANQFWIKNATNTAFIPMTMTGSGTFPVLGPFLLYKADSNYPNGFNLGALGNGFIAQNTSLGISTPYIIPFPVTVPEGGSGIVSYTPYSVFIGGATSTSPFSQVTGVGAAGQVLTSSGAGLAPSWQHIPLIAPVTSIITAASYVTIPNTSPLNLTSISLTAGTWLISGNIYYFDAISSTPIFTVGLAGISTTSATFADLSTVAESVCDTGLSLGVIAPSTLVTIAITTTYYLVGQLGYAGTATMCGQLIATPVFS